MPANSSPSDGNHAGSHVIVCNIYLARPPVSQKSTHYKCYKISHKNTLESDSAHQLDRPFHMYLIII